EFNLAGVNVESLHTAPGTSKFDMTLELSEESGILQGDLEYSTDLFEEETIVQMMEHFQQLIQSAVENPTQPIGGINILTKSDKDKLLIEYNSTDVDHPLTDCIHSLFENQVAKDSDAVALVDGQERLTYGELNERSNRLAHHLIHLGVTRETLVGVCMARDADMVVALLAILKSGGAYVPIDPNYPADRVAYMLADASAPLVISHSSLNGMLPPASENFQPVFVDRIGPQLRDCASNNPQLDIAADHLAYVIYTSGSTGKPKGVMISHGNASGLIHWAQGVFSEEDLSGVLAATSICFDLSVYELFVTLSAGGKIILADNVLALPTLPAKSEVVLVNTVPSAIATLLRENGIPDNVKVINLAGEALAASLVDGLYQNTCVERVYDLYGPSEDTTYSTFTLREIGKAATIGRPIDNTKAYILNQHGALVAPGLAGELYLSGTGVTRGYRNREDLTQEKYLPNPFENDPKYARMYRTGDLVRYMDNGNLEYLGRIDHQVKVRGFRIELGEIQSVLNSVDGVQDSLVLTREDAAGAKCLVAYLVAPEGNQSELMQQARAVIRAQLPEYMLPSAFVILEAFPLTPNGKVDRARLPVPSIEDLIGDQFVEPRTENERKMAAIWRHVLKLDKVGVTNNFFELGGHSLLATQCISRIREEFGVELPVKLLFTTPTIESLCLQLDNLENLADLMPPPVKSI
ncbi:MAG: non-ribosomal peptide synthetase, partial [Ketobacter sp.]